MRMYNLLECSDNYSDISDSLWQFKRDEIEVDVDLTVIPQHIQIVCHPLSINQVLLQTEMLQK